MLESHYDGGGSEAELYCKRDCVAFTTGAVFFSYRFTTQRAPFHRSCPSYHILPNLDALAVSMDTPGPFASPPRIAPRGRGNGQTRFEKETAANGGKVDTGQDPPHLGPWVLGDTIGKGSSGV